MAPLRILLVLRTDLGGHPTFREVLHSVRRVVLDAYAHQDLPFEKLVEELCLKQTTQQNPLVRVLFVWQAQPIQPLVLHGMELSSLPLDRNMTKFDLVVSLWEEAQGLSGQVNYQSALFDHSTIVRLVKHLDTLLHSLILQPDGLVDTLKMYNETEQQQHTDNQAVSYEALRHKLKTTRRNVINFERPPLTQ